MTRAELIKTISDYVLLGATLGASYYLMSTYFSETFRSSDEQKRSTKHLKKLSNQSPELKEILGNLSQYEKRVLAFLVPPEEINVSFDDIGGLENVVADLKETIILPMTHPELFEQYGSLLTAPKGVLLHGPPGCGKTMLAKALAKESGSNFINVRISTVMEKWVGDSNKMVDALFSLAHKLEPCIIFIDEIDAFLRERNSADHEVTAGLKAEFMTLWDGLVSSGRVLVLGATNRPYDIDSAILRRMPKRFNIGLPTEKQRVIILQKILGNVELDFKISKLAEITDGMSGSELRELCRGAAVNSTREFISKNIASNGGFSPVGQVKLRALELKDFINSMDPSKAMQVNLTEMD